MSTEQSIIAELAKASRYLFELTATMPFDEAIERVKSKADTRTGSELDSLRRYIRGQSTARPARELALYADFLKELPQGTRANTGVASLNASLNDARALADGLRAGLPTELVYPGLVLIVAASIATLWVVYVAPEFVALFAQFEARLPAWSRVLMANAWLVFAPIAVLLGALVALASAGYRLAAAIETMTRPSPEWVGAVIGKRVGRAHDRWRLAAIARARIAAGVAPTVAVRGASLGALADYAALEQELSLADELGLAAHEIGHQLEQRLIDYGSALELRRAIAFRVLQIAIAAVVATIVIAIYLPILRMGAVI